MANGADDNKQQPKSRCIMEVLDRVGRGATTKDDADYLFLVLDRAGIRISTLEIQVAQLQRRLATVH